MQWRTSPAPRTRTLCASKRLKHATARSIRRSVGIDVLDVRRDPWRFAAVFCRVVTAALHARSLWVTACLALSLTSARPGAWAQSSEHSAAASEASGQWYVGAYYRHAWTPSFVLKTLFERAASISNEGVGLSVSHTSAHGVTAQIGLGYQGFHFEGAFNPNSSVIEDTEWVTSKLGLVHLTGSVLWPVTLHRMLTLEIGLGADLGVVTGNLHRTEAYPEGDAFHPCEGPLAPDVTGPNEDQQGMPAAYCEQAYDRNGDPIPTSGASISGAHYNDRESRVPPLMLIPMLPHLALRFEPTDQIAIKLEGAFGLAQFWLGASVHVGFGRKHKPVQPPEPEPEEPIEARAGGELEDENEVPPAYEPATATVAAAPATGATKKLGRVIGKLMEDTTKKPIAHASVKNQRMFSAIQTDSAGLFVFENVEPGPLRLEIAHPDYNSAGCDVTIPAQGGDINVHCFLRPGIKEGAISGQVKDQDGKPVAGARVEITGALSTVTLADASGLFAMVDAPPGTYRVRVTAAGYLTQLIELEVLPRDTALPQIILLRNTDVSPREVKP